VRSYLSKMVQYNLVRATGESVNRQYQVVEGAVPSPD
jgi:hypothetical protein